MLKNAQIGDMAMTIEELASKCRHERFKSDEYRSVITMKRAQLQELEAELNSIRRRDHMAYNQYWQSSARLLGDVASQHQQPANKASSGKVVATEALASDSEKKEVETLDANIRTDLDCRERDGDKSSDTVLIMPATGRQVADQEDNGLHDLCIDECTTSPAIKQSEQAEVDELGSLSGTPPPSPDDVTPEEKTVPAEDKPFAVCTSRATTAANTSDMECNTTARDSTAEDGEIETVQPQQTEHKHKQVQTKTEVTDTTKHQNSDLDSVAETVLDGKSPSTEYDQPDS